jgi:hypothetical protein
LLLNNICQMYSNNKSRRNGGTISLLKLTSKVHSISWRFQLWTAIRLILKSGKILAFLFSLNTAEFH